MQPSGGRGGLPAKRPPGRPGRTKGATMLQFRCPDCKTVLQALENNAGTKMACGKCGQRLQVPGGPKSKTLLAELVPANTSQPSPSAPQPSNPLASPPVPTPASPPAVAKRSDTLACPRCGRP